MLQVFSRYELKYLVDSEALAVLRDACARHLDFDDHGVHGRYDVWSLYYDTPDLRCYWDAIVGRPFRRKLRVRHYGDVAGVHDGSTVYVEIKQQVADVTEKRRAPLAYRQARQLCDGREMVERAGTQRGFLAEVLRLVSRLDLRPVAVIGYRRDAFVGRDAESGLRVTLDRRILGRDRELRLGADAGNLPVLPVSRAVLEIKADDRVPYWLTELTARNRLAVVRVSKYCQGVEALGHVPRSVFHVPG